jgi:hypothetical protein
MSPSARVNLLLVAHGLLAYGSVAAVLISSGNMSGRLALFAVLLFVSQLSLSGSILGLAESDVWPSRSRGRKPLARAWMGVCCLWLPFTLFLSALHGSPMPLFAALILSGLVVVFVSVVTTSTLRAFSLRLGDDSDDDASTPLVQFSLRQLIGLTTLVAAICGVPRLLAELDESTPMGGLLVMLSIVFGFVLAMGGLWLLTVGVPLFTVFIARRPWVTTVAAFVVIESIALGAVFALGARRTDDYLLLPAMIGGHQFLVMASLGVLRSCGVRLVRRTPRDADARRSAKPDFTTWPFDNRQPEKIGWDVQSR